MPTLTRKNDLIIWTHLSEAQIKIYNDFTESEDVKQVSRSLGAP